jgi:hypothetical protein
MNETEKWLTVKDSDLHPDERIDISSFGNVRRKWLNQAGYQSVSLSFATGYATFYVRLISGKRAMRYVHRVMAETYLVKKNNRQDSVIHLDYDKRNNHITNLQWVDRTELMLHQQNNPNILHKGRKHGYKITPKDVKVIFELVDQGESKAAVARKFGVSPTQIRRILSRKNWQDIPLH